jgi:arylsulfatase A-like enzyme
MRVLVLHTSALHLGCIGCYGSDWVATPHLDRLAAEGVVFDRHFADCPEPCALHGSHFTGRYRFPSPSVPEPELAWPLLPDMLRGHGIEPLLLESDDLSGPEINRWARAQNALAWINLAPLSPPWDIPDEILAPYFLAADEEEALSPWFDPPTGPFDDDDRERVQNTYAARVSLFDAQIGMALAQLEEERVLDDVLICVTASCGLAVGERGYLGPHRAWLHEELVHVPLILRLPGAAEAGLRLSALTQPVDLLPTILAALDLPPAETHGFNLLPLIRGEMEQVRPHACSGLAIGDSVEWSLRTPEWAYLLPLSTPSNDPPREPQLFVKPDDRWEVNDVRQHHLELTEHLEEELRSFVAKVRG